MFSKILRRLKSNVKLDETDTRPNITIGENSSVTGHIDVSRAPRSKISIGKDCSLFGHISLETNDAILEIGNNVFIGPNTRIVCVNKVIIESDILISADCLIQDSDNHSLDFQIRKKDNIDWKNNFHDWSKHPNIPIKISNGAWIGAKVIILKGVTIGEKSVVGAGSVVTKNTLPYSVYAGNPAKFIKNLIPN